MEGFPAEDARTACEQQEVHTYYPFVDAFRVGEGTLAYITRMREPSDPGTPPGTELLVGDVLRRTCQFGGVACAQICQAPKGYANDDKRCSDLNLKAVTESMGIRAQDMLMVGVTADGVGYYDQLQDYGDKVRSNSVGIRELPGYNAFFARSSENIVLGARLADCGFAAIEFKDRDGENVAGFVHLTRTNLQGRSKLGFEVDGEPAGSFEYFMHEALRHYGGDIESVNVRLVAAIKAENFHYTFKNRGPEDIFPGWYEQGLLENTSNSDWKPGNPIDPTDAWEPAYRDMLRYQILRSGIEAGQLSEEGVIDPADLELGHASNQAGAHGKMPDARDAYLVVPRTYWDQ